MFRLVSSAGLYCGRFYWLRRRLEILWHILVMVFRTCWRRPTILIKSLAIMPQVI